jgi:putative tryptophan/tyrosine transport system substrate-binding protein
MNRRALISLLGGAAVAWPLAARAQQPAMPVIGFLHPTSPDAFTEPLRGFRQALKESGFVESETVAIEYRWADHQTDRLPALAAELVRRRVAVIATFAPPAAFAAKAATTTIPIVFNSGDDPVGLGLVASLARPGGNLTGINIFSAGLAAKRLDLLHELVPGAAHVGVLVNPADAMTTEATLRDLAAAAAAIGLQTHIGHARSAGEIDAAFASFARERLDALFVGADPFLTSRRVQLANLASRHALPMITATREITDAGGLMSYGANIPDAWRQVGLYTARLLKGATPADLPVVQATKLELVINVQTARTLGLDVPAALLATADEVIE